MLAHLRAIGLSTFAVICSSINQGTMAQKPIAMEQLKQRLQLKNAWIRIREMDHRFGISRNSVRKHLALLEKNTDPDDVAPGQ